MGPVRKHPKIDKSTKEKVIQDYLLGQLRKFLPDAYVTKVVEAYPNGTPDVVVCHKGTFVGIEVKRPYGGRVSELQMQARDKILRAGGCWHIVKLPEEVDALIDQLLGESCEPAPECTK